MAQGQPVVGCFRIFAVNHHVMLDKVVVLVTLLALSCAVPVEPAAETHELVQTEMGTDKSFFNK